MKNLLQYCVSRSLLSSCLFVTLLVLAACAGELGPPPTLVPIPSPVPKIGLTPTLPGATPTASSATATLAVVPNGTVVAPTVTASPPQDANSIPQGITSEGYYFLGREDAPNTIIMYSDTF